MKLLTTQFNQFLIEARLTNFIATRLANSQYMRITFLLWQISHFITVLQLL